MNKFEIYNHKQWLDEVDVTVLVPKLDAMLKASGYTVINFVEHQFTPQGYTALWLLAESHLAVHTFPEDGRAYIELSSCNEVMNKAFIEQMQSWVREMNLTHG